MDDPSELAALTEAPVAVTPRPREYLSLFGHAVANASDIALLVIGTGLVSLAVAVVLDGFDLATLNLTDGTGAMLGSALVIGIFGAFALGVASEGPIGHRSYAWLYSSGPVIIMRVVAVFAVGFGLFTLARYLPGITDGLPNVFGLVTEMVRVTGLAGMTAVPLIGVPVAAGLRYFYGSEPWVEELELPLLYVVWLVTVMVLLF